MPSRLTRIAGLFAIAGSVLLMLGGTFMSIENQRLHMTPHWMVVEPGVILIVFSIVGILVRHRRHLGKLGLAGAVMAGAAVAATPALGWAAGVVSPFLALGVAILAVQIVRANILPRAALALIGVGALLAWSSHSWHLAALEIAGFAVVCPAWAWMGARLFQERAPLAQAA